MEWLFSSENLIGLLTLTALEIVLGIDNIVFLSILCGKLPEEQRGRARFIGLGLAMVMRILLLLSLTWLMGLTEPLFELPVLQAPISGKGVILIAGGLFLLAKATREIHHSLEGQHGEVSARVAPSFSAVITQLVLIDLVFSLDSVITAVGMVQEIGVMILAVVIAVLVMMIAARPIGAFVERHPTVKMLALSFLLMIGLTLIADGLGVHVPKGYVYFAMGFSVFVEALNLWMAKRAREPVRFRRPYARDDGGSRPGPAR